MSKAKTSASRLWVQVPEVAAETGEQHDMGALAATFLASGVGAIVKTASDHLVATDTYTLSSILAYEPAFGRTPDGSDVLLPQTIVLSVGPEPIPENLLGEEPFNPIKCKSPFVVRIGVAESRDRTAVCGVVSAWKYAQPLSASGLFRSPSRKLTVEIKMTDADGRQLLVFAIQLTGTPEEIGRAVWDTADRLPWSKRPSSPAPEGATQYGVVNIEGKIVEAVEPSGFAKFLGGFLGSQKAAVETYVKDRVTELLAQPAAPEAQLKILDAANQAWEAYETAHKEALAAREALDRMGDAEKAAASHAVAIRQSVLRQRELLARKAFNTATVAFTPLPTIPTA